MEYETPLIAVRGIGPVRSRLLAEAGYGSIGELLYHLPFRWEDRRRVTPVAEIAAAGPVTVRGRLRRLRRVRIRRRGLSLVRGVVEDGSGSLPAVWFNRPYLTSQVEEGSEYLFHGSVRNRAGGWELVNSSLERSGKALFAGAVVPVYPALGRLGSGFLRRLIREILSSFDPVNEMVDDLPRELRERHDLPAVGQALADLHQPAQAADVEALNARRSPAHGRLIYGELLDLQLELGYLRAEETRVAKRHRYRWNGEVERALRSILPFRLTGAQERVVAEIVGDLTAPEPMLRLLQGDVGSGKTIVAALALVLAAESGLQAAFMAPTELLAEQHFQTLERLLGGIYRIGLVTASAADAPRHRRQLSTGELQLAVGTHALIQERVEFRRLGLAIIDEQHRFGVAQRQLLQSKGDRLDLLVMTATPIPRSLALTLYGDLALSTLDEMPPGRQPVTTRLRPVDERERVYSWLGERLAAGAQAYVVLPLIEESDRLGAASIARHGEALRTRFAAFRPRLLHGRTPVEEREAIMAAFARGDSRLLIATTVIEVGVDVPAAEVMVIENAERFGLAQLHQLRGRIGRGGGGRAVCVALHGELGQDGESRLRTFASTRDGFRIAEADLELRGPGDLLGTRQAGLPRFRVASLVTDGVWLERARRDALELLAGPRSAAPRLLDRARERSLDRYRRLAGG